MTAFEGAVEMGYRHIETDIQMTSDGVIVCIHDPTVDRTTDASGAVSSYTYSELTVLDAGYRHANKDGYVFRGQGARISSFEEVVTTFPDVSFVVDIKSDGIAESFARLIDRLEVHERVIVGAFSDDRLAEFRRLTAGRVATSTGPMLSRMWLLASRAGRGVGSEASALQVPTHMRGVRVVDEKLIEAANKSGLQVHVWTVNDSQEMAHLLDMGVDGLITDRPDRLKTLLVERGEWAP